MDSSLAAERTTTRARASLPTQEALAELLPKVPTGPVADAEIRRRVLEEINNQRWTQPNNIDAKVEDGTVELRGVVLSEAERATLWVVAENVPGVKGVRDRLALFKPLSGTIIEPPMDC